MKGAFQMSTSTIENPKVVSQAEWLVARKQLLAKEKSLTRERDAIAAARRSLPWVKVDKDYVFDSPNGKKTLSDLFESKSQLIVYHFMFGPDWQEGCPVAPSLWTIPTPPWCIWLSAMLLLSPFHERPLRRSSPSRNGWAGGSAGSRRTTTTSTTTMACRSQKKK